MPRPTWNIREVTDTAAIQRLRDEVGVQTDIAKMLYTRGITDFDSAKRFFRPSLEDLHDPFLMKDMDLAVQRLQRALGDGEKVLVYGDYDVDGTTSVALVFGFLKDLGQFDYYIPDRYAEGYGLSSQGIDFAAEHGFSLIVTLDCGIRAVDKVAYAKTKGIDLIICDHHLPGPDMPDAVAVLDPKRPDCPYPYKELCGCGVGFKFMQAFCMAGGADIEALFARLDLLAVAIAADIVPITGENRILAHFGMQVLNSAPCMGIKVLLENANVKKELSIADAVFIIGPRINAAGRIASGKKAVELLISENADEARDFAKQIAEYNTTRRELDKSVTEMAVEMVASDSFYATSSSTVVWGDGWHKGVVGIVASRLIDTWYKPTIVLALQDDGTLTGSARSVEGFDVHDAICQCADLLDRFGGHTHAAGLSLRVEHVQTFRQRFEEIAAARITEEMTVPLLHIDAELDLHRITPKFMALLKQFAPFGPGNMSPVFVTRKLKATDVSLVGGDGTHLRFKVYSSHNAGYPLPCIAFKMAEFFAPLHEGQEFDMVYSIEENHWNGRITLQLQVKDIRIIL
jgi:single-stranded-DNA-specific exonuclease